MLQKLRESTIKSEYFRNVSRLVGGTAVAQVISVLVAPILSRLYSPADFGSFAVYASILSVLLMTVSFRYELGIVIAKTRTEALHLLGLSFLFLVGICLTSLILFFIWQDAVAAYMAVQRYRQAVYLIPLATFFAGGYQILSHWANRSKDFPVLAGSRVAQSGANAGLSTLLGGLGFLELGLLLGHGLGTMLSFGVLLRRCRGALLQGLPALSTRRLRHTLVKYREFPLFSLPNALLDSVSLSLPVFLITSFFSADLTGQYALAYRVIYLPLGVVGMAVSQVFFQKLSETFHRKGDCRGLVTGTWRALFLVGLGPTLLIIFLGPALFRFVFGPEWEEAGRMASILALPLFFSFCSAPTSSALVVYRMQKLLFIFGILGITLRPLAFYGGYVQGDLYLSLMLWAAVETLLLLGYNVVVYRRSPGQ